MEINREKSRQTKDTSIVELADMLKIFITPPNASIKSFFSGSICFSHVSGKMYFFFDGNEFLVVVIYM